MKPRFFANIASLAVFIAVGAVCDGLQELLPLHSEDRIQTVTKVERVNYVGLKNIRPVGVTPDKSYSLLIFHFFSFFFGDCDRLQLKRAICPYNAIDSFEFRVGLRKILAIRNVAIKIMDGYPRPHLSGAGSPGIEKLRSESVADWVSILIGRDIFGKILKGNDGAQLFSRIDLRFVGNAPLLIDENQTDSVGYKQQPREQGDRPGPFDQITVKLAWGITWLAAGIALTFKTIWHGVFSDRPRWRLFAFGLVAAGGAIIYGLSNIF
jgi:hypothetical protein